jgi:hypothetical protein
MLLPNVFKLEKLDFIIMIKKNNKRSQAKIMEMSFMIIALVVFFVIVALFVLLISTSSMKQSANDAKTMNINSLIVGIAGTPEFNCGERLCVDTDKILVLKNSSAYKTYWADIAGLVVKKIYPADAKSIECSLGNYPACDTYTIVSPGTNVIAQSSYVNLCRREYKNGYPYQQCDLGKIIAYTKVLS